MRLNIYSSSCLNNRIKVNGHTGSRENGKYSEPPPNAAANSKAVGGYLAPSSPLLVFFPVVSLSSTAEIVFLVIVSSLQCVSLHSTNKQVSFQTGFTVTNCILISFCLAVAG